MSLAGLCAVCLTVPELAAPICIRVVETPTAAVVERLAARAHVRAQRRHRRPRLDLDDLIARAEIINAHGPNP